MLSQSRKHSAIRYVNASGENIPIIDHLFDVVTMAGSLNYINREILVGELSRVCRCNADIIIYDFIVDMSGFLTPFKLENKFNLSGYDHQINLSGFPELELVLLDCEELQLVFKPAEAAHFMCLATRWRGHGGARARAGLPRGRRECLVGRRAL